MDNIPYGYCGCGCGQRTRLSPENDASKGWVKGEPIKYVHGHQHRKPWSYAIEDHGYSSPCWIWQGRTHKGYAVAGGKPRRRVYRELYERVHGPIPEGLEPDHLCGVKACVNPNHLEPVSHTENMRRANRTKLTMDKAREIRYIAATTDLSYAAIGRMFGVYSNSVRLIVLNRQWKE